MVWLRMSLCSVSLFCKQWHRSATSSWHRKWNSCSKFWCGLPGGFTTYFMLMNVWKSMHHNCSYRYIFEKCTCSFELSHCQPQPFYVAGIATLGWLVMGVFFQWLKFQSHQLAKICFKLFFRWEWVSLNIQFPSRFKACILFAFLGQHLAIKPPDGLPILTLESSSRDEAISMPVLPMMSWSAVFEKFLVVLTLGICNYVAHPFFSFFYIWHRYMLKVSLRHQMLFKTYITYISESSFKDLRP